MAKILLIISALVIAATAYLGFATKQKVDALQGELTDKKKAVASLTTDVSKAKGAQKKAEEELVAAKADLEVKEKDLAAKKVEVETITANLTTSAAKVTELEAKIASLGNPANPSDPAVDVEKIKGEIAELKTAKSKLESDLAEAMQIKGSLEKNLADERSKATAAQSLVQAYKNDFTKPGVTGTVLAYNPGWNFVVLSIGDKQGLKSGKEMVVTRDGQMVGKVRVRTVEPSTSIGDVIPNTVPKGQSVQPGDRVIYEGATK